MIGIDPNAAPASGPNVGALIANATAAGDRFQFGAVSNLAAALPIMKAILAQASQDFAVPNLGAWQSPGTRVLTALADLYVLAGGT